MKKPSAWKRITSPIGHCIVCNKPYKKWKWIHKHFEKEHPQYNLLIRIKEIADSMNAEAKAFAELPKAVWKE